MSDARTKIEFLYQEVLGDVHAILEKMTGLQDHVTNATEETATMLKEAHELISKDLELIGVTVSSVDRALSETMEEIQDVVSQVRDIRAKASIQPVGPPVVAPIKIKTIWMVSLVSSLVAAAIAAVAISVINYGTIEQARIGRAVTNALPYLDPVTRQKLQVAINKTGG